MLPSRIFDPHFLKPLNIFFANKHINIHTIQIIKVMFIFNVLKIRFIKCSIYYVVPSFKLCGSLADAVCTRRHTHFLRCGIFVFMPSAHGIKSGAFSLQLLLYCKRDVSMINASVRLVWTSDKLFQAVKRLVCALGWIKPTPSG